ncbi:dTDP-3-amino-3,6-dideoxy-alpha-D-galactopyranose transaminase [Streptomyces sp. YIM 130001]|nr:dTDP-3-amino-3,6-dideoxy-alpha-D-galactopyranose transaminase [Streptomyces sp. YIM 130001]
MNPQEGKAPFVDLHASYVELKAEIDAAWERVMRSGRYLLGPEVESFEAEFAAYCGGAHCVAVGSGCDALELILRAHGIGPGDEVIVPAHTFIATWLAVTAVGARPVPVEPESGTYTLGPAPIEAAVTSRTRAVLPVHLYGHPADLAAVTAVAVRHNLLVVEDAAQATGARCRGLRVGAGSAPVAFSFHPSKNLGAMGDGGAVVTSDADLARRIRMLRNYGSRTQYHHEVQGTNSRLDELQAAILRVKLTRLDEWNARRAAVAARYHREMARPVGPWELVLPQTAPWAEPVWHQFVIRSVHREELRWRLAEKGIDTMIHYPVPVHRSPAYSGTVTGPLPLTERLAGEVLSLPIGPHMPADQIEAVVSTLIRILEDAPEPAHRHPE